METLSDDINIDLQEIKGNLQVADEQEIEKFNTLDEDILTTIFRDVKEVGKKFSLIIFPQSSQKKLLFNWDLWGPLFLCMALALLLREKAAPSQKSFVFTSVFVILWIGSAIVTVNSQLLGGTLSFFQSLCLLGYCNFPLITAAVSNRLITFFLQGSAYIIIKVLLVVAGFAWALYASFCFQKAYLPSNYKPLVVYPLALFYFLVGCLVYFDQ